MADEVLVEFLIRYGVAIWNAWREDPPFGLSLLNERPDLSGANLSSRRRGELKGHPGYHYEGLDLSGVNLSKVDLSGANLIEAKLSGANLIEAKLSGANLSGADLHEADLSGAKLTEANLSGANLEVAKLTEANFSGADLHEADLHEAELSGANLSEANLSGADLSRADLSDADLRHSALVKTNLTGTTLTGCSIYGISAWSLKLEGTIQQDLNVSDLEEPAVMVDNLEVAQFVYLLLNNEKIRDIIDTIGKKGVLILGRFTEERKAVLDAIRDRLRELRFVPMMVDFARPTQQDFDETIKTLAGLSRFIIADITNPKSSPLELQAIMPDYMVPFVPIIHEDEEPFAMFQGLQHKYGEWVLDVLEYDSAANLQERLYKAVVKPALDKSDQLILKKAEAIRTRHISDYQ
jgi:uncharacterized protein YjbI with pentapeptide repeats